MVTLTIDGQEVKVEEGTTVLEAAKGAGIEIPTLCYHPDLTPYGACRVCVVEVFRNGWSQVTASCTLPVREGMKVETRSPRGPMVTTTISTCSGSSFVHHPTTVTSG